MNFDDLFDRDYVDAMTYCFEMLEREHRKADMVRCQGKEAFARRQLAIRNGKVFLQGDKTVLKVGDDVYVAKCEKGDKYDLEKGLMVCIMKAFGFGTKDFLHLFENAKGQPYKEPVKNSKKSLKGDKNR